LQGHLKNFREDVQELNTKVLQAALALHDKVGYIVLACLAVPGISSPQSCLPNASSGLPSHTCCLSQVSTSFRKTAVNFHYEFTVRHLANVFQGLLMSSPEQFNSPSKWGKLWLHESERVYADRLVGAAAAGPPGPAQPSCL
jgi:dynein heavy chain